MRRFPLYKGATRPALVFGVPLLPLVALVMVVALLAMVLGLLWWALLVPLWLLMAEVTRADSRAFRVLWLFLRTKGRNRARVARAGCGDFWGASSYAPSNGARKSSDREDSRWRG